MTLNESIGRFHVRKTLCFEMKPVGRTADHLPVLLADDEERAESLNTVKDIIEAEHLALIRRVFKSLPDPLPCYAAIKDAFKADPHFAVLSSRGANEVMKLILDRCHYNHWPIPKQMKDLEGWQPLFIKWHWHCYEPYQASGESAVAREWAGHRKAEIEATSVFLRPRKKRKPSRNYWFDHSPFRMMFDNHSCGMSWLKEDFRISRTFILKDGDRIMVGIVPRSSKFNPYAMARPLPTEQSYSLYEETAGENPKFRLVPRALVDAPAHRGFVYLFELTGRGLRGKTNLDAIYIRALFSAGNLDNPSLHLDKVCEFYARKSTDIPRAGLPDHFRQRFSEDKFFVAFHMTCNPQFIAIKNRPQPFGDLSKFVETNPCAKFVTVSSVTGGYRVDDTFVSSLEARNGRLSGLLAKTVVDRDAYVLFDPSVPKPMSDMVVDKLGYVVVRGREPSADGGVLRGYQLVDRVFAGRLADAQAAVDMRMATKAEKERKAAAVQEAIEKVRQAKLADQEARRARNEEELRKANERRSLREQAMGNASTEVFNAPIFQTGKFLFKFGYKTSDNTRHEQVCHADSKDDVFQKLRTIGVRPYRVECDDPEFVGVRKDLPGPDVGTKTYEYAFRDSSNIRHDGTILADTKDEAYAKLRKLAINPFFVAEAGTLPSDRTATAPAPDVGQLSSIAPAPVVAVPVPSEKIGIADRLKRLNGLKDMGLLSEAEYAEQRAKILSEL